MDRKILFFTVLILAAACKLAEELVGDVAGLVGLKGGFKVSGHSGLNAAATFALQSYRFPEMSYSFGSSDSDD